jgi:alpha-galactosidase
MLRRVVKIAFIGAGSVEFTRDLLADLLTFEELSDVRVALHDIDPERLETAEAMARWTNERLGGRAQISTHASRREALDGADFAINMIQVGGLEATLLDFEIPARNGLRQMIADTLGIGGIFRALRTIPVMLGIGADMAELCPDAWLLNYTNPMAMLCQAYGHGSPHTKIVGLCHSVQHTTRRLADLAGVPFEDVAFVGAGVNHQAFILRFERAGENLYPRLDERIAGDEDLQRTVRVEMYRRLGYFPTESSEHSAEYLPWLMHDDAALEHFRIPADEYVRRSEDNLPDGACVEVPCLVDGAGVWPTRIGSLPPQCAALNRTFLNVVELTVQAALEGSREHVYHAAMLDPNAAASLDLDTIRTVCDELIEAHGDALPAGVRG